MFLDASFIRCEDLKAKKRVVLDRGVEIITFIIERQASKFENQLQRLVRIKQLNDETFY